MLVHFMISTYRNLAKNPLYTALNVAGLASGLAACILILLYVRGEFNFDRWLPQAERIYRVHTRFDIPGRQPFVTVESAGPVLPKLSEYYPQIEVGTRIHVRRPKVQRNDTVFFDRLYLVDPTFFEVFDIPLLEGHRATALSDTSSIILSKAMAQKYFGDEPAIGKTLTIDDGVRDREFRVAAVIANAPKDSHLRWDLIGRFEPAEFKNHPWVAEQWTSMNVSTYFKVKSKETADPIAASLPEFERKVVPNVNFSGQDFPTHEFLTLSIMPMLDLHLHATSRSNSAGTRYSVVIAFAAIAVLIVIIACINFMNLATARASQRAREVALRKVVGASRRALVVQFLGESTLLAVLSLILALGAVELALPAYNQFLDRELVLHFFGADGLAPLLLALVVCVGIVGGLYPAVYLSRFRPAQVLKANRSSDNQGSTAIRGALVIVQFAISIALIICTAVVYGQYLYTQNKDLGFKKDGLIVVRGLSRSDAQGASELLRTEVARLPGVISVTRSVNVPGDSSENNAPVQRRGDTAGEPLILGLYGVDWHFFETYRIPLKAGRYFDEARANDDASPLFADGAYSTDNNDSGDRVFSVLLNERAARRLGYASPVEAVGARLSFSRPGQGAAQIEVVGVVKDFHYRSIREEIRPTFYIREGGAFSSLTVRVAAERQDEVMTAIMSLWRKHVPNLPFNSDVLDESLKSLYEEERAQAQIFGAFALLAVSIACLGLYGLAAFAAARRTKEIGVRKVLGASNLSIVRLLVWQFSKPVLIANLIAWPVSAYLMQRWLDSFEYRISLQPLVFVAASVIAVVIAWLTVGGHALRVARTRPSRALRYE